MTADAPKPLAQVAQEFCEDPKFIEWINSHHGLFVMSKVGAANWLGFTVGVKYFWELDKFKTRSDYFKREIQEPFLAWKSKH